MWNKVWGNLLHFSCSHFGASPTENMKYLMLPHLGRGYLHSSDTRNEVTTCTGISAVVHCEANTWLSRSNFFTCSHPFPSFALLPGIAY